MLNCDENNAINAENLNGPNRHNFPNAKYNIQIFVLKCDLDLSKMIFIFEITFSDFLLH